jgi:hypothetical protein
MQDMPFASAATATPAVGRHDLYQAIHKALRRLYADTLVRLGQADPDDDAALAPVLAQVRTLCEICEVHYADEDRFMHPALERVQPGCTAAIAAEHETHRATLDAVRERVAVVEASRGATRRQALNRLYQDVAVLMAEDLVHMRVEDEEFNAVLWRHYDDAGALNAPERSAFLAGARQGMPPPVFEAVVAIARQELPPAEWHKLATALQLPTA